MIRIRIAALLVLAGGSIGVAQAPAALTFHDLATMTRHPLGRMQARGAMGQTGSIMVTELPPGLKTTPHHHHQEQMMLGLDGGMHYQMAGKPYPLGRLTAAIALPNVEHGNINETAAQATCIEFQPALRPDWFPPHPRVAREGAPAPVAIPAGRTVTEDFSAPAGWRAAPGGARSKSLVGDTIRLTLVGPAGGLGARRSHVRRRRRTLCVRGGWAGVDRGRRRATHDWPGDAGDRVADRQECETQPGHEGHRVCWRYSKP